MGYSIHLYAACCIFTSLYFVLPVSKQTKKTTPPRPEVKKEIKKEAPVALATPPKPFRIPYPMLWLAAVVLVLYFGSIHFGLTELDDAIFIKDLHQYNENLGNLLTSFHRGLFNATKDTYYRPLFLDSMILNYQSSEMDPTGYHLVNVLLHLVNVLLLYQLFRKLNIRDLHAFLLSLLFAIHPVLSQAVAWIPGRNDTMLALFTLTFLIFTINYANSGKLKWLLLSTVFLLLAFFTKETAVFDAPVAFVILVFLLQKSWLDKRNITQYVVWVAVFILWFVVRNAAIAKAPDVAASAYVGGFFERLPVVVQYLGKIFLPFNLSVFPMQEDTVYYYGIAAIVILIAAIALVKNKNWRVIGSGLAIFLLFLIPALLVPNTLNDQTFEHRLYLPIIGILIVLSQTVFFKNNLADKQLTIIVGIVAIVFAVINYNHQQSFSDPLSFWKQAGETSPNSSFADMMLGAREPNKADGEALFRKAYAINPKEKYLNYYYGVMLQGHDSILQSEKYLLAEKSISDYYECDFYLARVAIQKKDLKAAQAYLERYITRDPANPQANNNLLVLYLQTNQRDKAKAQVTHMQQIGQSVAPGVLQQLK